ncbi:CDP-alcohol phosphatidyltransferase family protein [Kribbella sp. NPDC051770]|uniref:CDP-alcohol phosphatidyltransferase family protein n=1 Tax=Kribbella sp. NPDC051770 TaxID=3155413 RepID=UPI00342E6015
MSTTQIPRPASVELLLGLPNQITLVRTLVAMTVATIAFVTGDFGWLVAGYLTYWLGDSLDGGVARYLKQETVVGAVFDIVCDRASSFLLAAAFMTTYPDTVGPLAIYLVQFGVLDTMLSLSFLLWKETLSPNYFYKVDQPIYVWNWSKPAKAVNTGAVVVSLVIDHLLHVPWLPYGVAAAAAAVKIASLTRLVAILRGRRDAVPAVR